MLKPHLQARSTTLLTLGLSAFGAGQAQELQGNPNAPAGQQPFVDVVGNTPVVLISEPNAAGVSRNEWTSFGVTPNNLVFNNATATAESFTVGKVGANPFLKTSAQVILNEVVGGSPSQLLGVIEVVGGRADVVIANPYGVACNGCGFLNAGRVTLTTGKGEFDASGAVKGFKISAGSVLVGEKGLNASDASYFDIISRSAQIGGALYGKNVRLITGANVVDYASLAAQTTSLSGEVPTFAIDVGALGSIYAGQVYLVSTEAGVGVRSEGQVYAENDLHLSADGTISLGGSSGGTNVSAKAQNVQVSGTVYAKESASVQASGKIETSGTLGAGQSVQLKGQEVNSTSSGVIAAGLQEDGKMGSGGTLNVQASRADLQGSSLSAGEANFKADELNFGGTVAATTINALGKVISSSGAVQASTVNLKAEQVNVRAGTVQGQTVKIEAGGLSNVGQVAANTLTVKADEIKNSGTLASDQADLQVAGGLQNSGTLAAKTLKVSAGGVTNSGSLSGEQVDITATTVNNSGGEMAADTLNLSAQHLGNVAGSILSQAGTFSVYSLDNRSGTLAGGTVSVQGGDLNNAQGTLSSRVLNVQATEINNAGGTLYADEAHLSAETFNNAGGTLGGKTLGVTAGQLNNRAGSILAEKGQVSLYDLDNQGGQIAVPSVTLQGGDLNNDRGIISTTQFNVWAQKVSNVGGTIAADQAKITADHLDNTTGVIAGGGLEVEAGELDNSGGRLSGKTLGVNVGELINRGGLLQGEAGSVTAVNLDNVGGTLAAHTLTVRGGNVQNDQGIISTTHFNAWAQKVSNVGGVIQAQTGNIHTGTLDNSQGVVAAKTLDITADTLLNREGQISSELGTLSTHDLDNSAGLLATHTVSVQGGRVTNTGGVISSQVLTANVESVENGQGTISSEQLDLKADQIKNAAGLIAGTQARLEAATLDNTSGTLAGDSLSVKADSLVNANGVISGTTTSLHAAVVNNTGGVITSRTLGIVAGRLVNAGGVVSGDQVSLTASTLDNTTGTVYGKNLNLTVQDLQNADGQVVGESGSLNLVNLLSNVGGVIAGGDVSVTGAELDNAGGTLSANKLSVTTGTLRNAGGTIFAKSGLVTAKTLDNTGGAIFGGQLGLNAGTLLNRHGQMAGEALTISAGSLNNAEGAISGERLWVKADSLDNRAGAIAGGKVEVQAGSLWNTQDSLTGTQLSVKAGGLDNSAGLISGDHLSVGAGALNNRGGTVYGNVASVQADSLDNVGGTVAGGRVSVSAGSLDNSGGGTLAGSQLSVSAGNLNSAGGNIGGGQVSVSAGSLDNAGGTISGTQLGVSAGNLNNASGTISGEQVSVSAGQLNNAGGTIAGTGVGVSAGTLDNTAGTIGGENVNVAVSGALTNTGGTIAGTTASVSAGSLTGDGKLIGSDTLSVTVRSGFTNTAQGQLLAGNRLNLNVDGDLHNDGEINSFGVLNAVVSGNLYNTRTMLGSELNVSASNVYNSGKKAVMAGIGNGFHVTVKGEMQNTDGATLYGLGNSSFSGPKLLNRSALVQVLGHFTVDGQLVNTRNYTTAQQTTSEQKTEKVTNASGQEGQRSYTETTTQTVITSLDPAGQIRVSGDLTVNGKIRNEASSIFAGGDLIVNGRQYVGGNDPDVVNVGIQNVKLVTKEGTDRYTTTTRECGTFMLFGGCFLGAWNDRIETTTSGYLDGKTSSEAIYGPDGRPVNTVISAGGTLVVNGDTVQNGYTAPVNRGGSGDLPAEAGPGNTAGGGTTAAADPTKTATTPTGGAKARTLPNTPLDVTSNAMFSVGSDPNAPLVTTDPRFLAGIPFTSSRDVLGDSAGRSIGDGFYEQQLFLNQMLLLRPQDPNLGATDALYKEMLQNGQTASQQFGFTAGVPLTPDQIAQLDHDIVLMEPQVVQTESGPQTVLVPRVYLAAGGEEFSGSIMTGRNVNMRLRGDLANDSTIYASDTLRISAYNINNNVGNLQAGRAAYLKAAQDVNNIGGKVQATLVDVQAGRDINAETLTRTYSAEHPTGQLTNTELTAGGFYGDYVSLKAGQDINLKGAQVVATKLAELDAGRDVNLSAVRQIQSKGTLLPSGKEYVTTNLGMGSTIASDNIVVRAGRDLNSEGTQFTGFEAGTPASNVKLTAGNNVNLFEVHHYQTTQQQGSSTTYGFLHLNKTTTNYDVTTELDISQGSSINAKNVTVHAGNDLNTRGLQITDPNTDQVSLTADGQVHLDAAQNKSKVTSKVQYQKSGLSLNLSGGLGIRLGSDQTSIQNVTTTVSPLKTTVNGNLIVVDGQKGVARGGSDLIANKGGKVLIEGNGYTITEKPVYQGSSSQTQVQSSGFGLTLGLKGNVVNAALDLANTAARLNGVTLPGTGQGAQGAQVPKGLALQGNLFASDQRTLDKDGNLLPPQDETAKDPEQKGPKTTELRFALGAHVLRSGWDLYNTAQQAVASQKAGEGSGLRLSLGADYYDNGQTVDQTSLRAVGNVTQAEDGTIIYHTVGDKSAANIDLEGSLIDGKRVILQASGTIDAHSAQNYQSTRTLSDGFNAGLGISGGIGGKGDVGITIDASFGVQNSVLNVWQRTNTGSIINGSDVTVEADTFKLRGGNLFADNLNMDVRKLYIESQYDQAGIEGSGSNFGISAAIPIYGNRFDLNVSGGIQDQNGTFYAVSTPSGIQAGKYTIKTEETELVGGYITTTGDPQQSTLTGNVIQRDLNNYSTYQNRSIGGSIGTGGINPNVGMTTPQNSPSTTQSSVTGTVHGTAQTGSPVPVDKDKLIAAYQKGEYYRSDGSLSLKTFTDLPAVMAEKQEAAAIFSKDADQTIGDVSKKWNIEDGSAAKVVMHGISGAITARLGGGNPGIGAVVGAANEFAVPTLDQLAQRAGFRPGTVAYDSAMRLGSFGLGSVVGTLAGGSGYALPGAGIAETATENNFLYHYESLLKNKAKIVCEQSKGKDVKACNEYQRWDKLDKSREAALKENCTDKASATQKALCVSLFKASQDAVASYAGKLEDLKKNNKNLWVEVLDDRNKAGSEMLSAGMPAAKIMQGMTNANELGRETMLAILKNVLFDPEDCKDPTSMSCAMAVASVLPADKAPAFLKKIMNGEAVGKDLLKLKKLLNGPNINGLDVEKAMNSSKVDEVLGSLCIKLNSFDPFTPVWTNQGLYPIQNLKIGDLVLAFNEATGQNGYYPITAVHRNLDPALTYLWVKSNTTGEKELITTTPEHPFYLAGNIDGSNRPAPQGHEDLSTRWVGAGHLKSGDQLKLADGSLGVVMNVTNVQRTQEMFNLTVETAHTFFVGANGWLVHNAVIKCPNGGLDLVNGRKPINSAYAGKSMSLPAHLQHNGVTDIKFNSSGYPDFSPFGEFKLLTHAPDAPSVPQVACDNLTLFGVCYSVNAAPVALPLG